MSRNKTQLRHRDSDGNIHRVTEENGNLFKGNTEERVEGRVSHYKAIHSTTRPDYATNNPYYGTGNGEMDDYAHTSDDL